MRASDRLEPLASLREVQTQHTAAHLAEAISEAAAREHALAAAVARASAERAAIDVAAARVEAAAMAGARAGVLAIGAAYLRRRRGALAAALAEQAAAVHHHGQGERALGAARQAWVEASARERVVQRYREKQALAKRRELDRREP